MRRVICLRVATIRGVRMRPLNDADLRETRTFEILGEENTETMCSRRQSLFTSVYARKKNVSQKQIISVLCVSCILSSRDSVKSIQQRNVAMLYPCQLCATLYL